MVRIRGLDFAFVAWTSHTMVRIRGLDFAFMAWTSHTMVRIRGLDFARTMVHIRGLDFAHHGANRVAWTSRTMVHIAWLYWTSRTMVRIAWLGLRAPWCTSRGLDSMHHGANRVDFVHHVRPFTWNIVANFKHWGTRTKNVSTPKDKKVTPASPCGGFNGLKYGAEGDSNPQPSGTSEQAASRWMVGPAVSRLEMDASAEGRGGREGATPTQKSARMCMHQGTNHAGGTYTMGQHPKIPPECVCTRGQTTREGHTPWDSVGLCQKFHCRKWHQPLEISQCGKCITLTPSAANPIERKMQWALEYYGMTASNDSDDSDPIEDPDSTPSPAPKPASAAARRASPGGDVTVIGSLGNLRRALNPPRAKPRKPESAALREERQLKQQERYAALRPLSKKQLRLLEAIAGEDGSGLRTRDFENAVYIAVDPLLIATPLTKTVYDEYRPVDWVPGARTHTMILISGGHRQKTSAKLTIPHDDIISQLEKKIQALDQQRREDRAADLRSQIDQVKLRGSPKEEMILESRQNSLTALVKLLTNNKIQPAADSEEHQLSTIFQLAHHRDAKDIESLLSYTQSLALKHRDAYTRLVKRSQDILAFIIDTRASAHFNHFLTDSQRIVGIQQEIWPLVEPVFRSMWRQVLFISSEADLPDRDDDEDEDDEDYASRVSHALLEPLSYISTPVLDSLIEAADEAYNEHLAPLSPFIGTANDEYMSAFEEYNNTPITEKSKLDEPQLWTPRDLGISEGAFAKIHVLLNEQTAYRHDNAPRLDGKIPLLSPMCGASMLDDWWSVRDVVYLVSKPLYICLSMLKTLQDFQLVHALHRPHPEHEQNRSQDRHHPIRLLPCAAIRYYLQYWIGSDDSDAWTSSTVQDMMDTIDEDGDPLSTTADAAFNALVVLLWRHREDVLRPVGQLYQPMERFTPYTQRKGKKASGEELEAHLVEKGPEFLREWLRHIADKHGLPQKEITPRIDPALPPEVAGAISTWEQENGVDHILPVFEALQSCAINYLVSYSGVTNNRVHYANILIAVHRELQYFYHYLAPFLDIVKPFGHFISGLFATVHAFPRLESAPVWLNLPISRAPVTPIRIPEYSDLAIRRERDQRQKNLWEWPIVEDSWDEERDEGHDGANSPAARMLTFPTSRLSDLHIHYRTQDVLDSLEDEDARNNDEITEAAHDVHFGTLRTAKRIRLAQHSSQGTDSDDGQSEDE
ncbi:hypothetical protein DFP72DRAFT_862133 [Ephemerocybe angulata]|uniref:Uncharacterized protein n=1 Tax=Ephemerocybe angulata TaxID=980116 RepID=A0A8H6H6S0_9AGAR|nr:hypothetical protein DFP72DRAFT_862133 [Tulosesus angulatus]